MPDTPSMRIAKFLAAAGLGSRRACERMILAGEVEVNGERLDSPALNVDPELDRIQVRGQPVSLKEKSYIVLNKPPGYTCSRDDPHASQLVHELIPDSLGHLFTVGRLDRDSEGLILLTNDGEFAQALTHPSRGVEKVYHVSARGLLEEPVRQQLLAGIRDDGELLRALDVRVLKQHGRSCKVEFRLGEGRKREVRRLCSFAHLGVVRLVRVSIGPLRLADLPSGSWRKLTHEEQQALRDAARPRKGEKGRART